MAESVNFALHGTDVAVTCAGKITCFYVDIDEGQIGQVIHNLIINASQAMSDGGTINVSARNVVLADGNDEMSLFFRKLPASFYCRYRARHQAGTFE